MPSPKLPRGLDPLTAGRWGLWLLGRRQHMRARLRNSCPPIYGPRSLADRAVALLWRWEVVQYPGKHRGLADLLGITHDSARHLMAGRRALTARNAERLASVLESDLAERRAVIDELRRHAAEHDARVKLARAECIWRARAPFRERQRARMEAEEARLRQLLD